jgi:hypothetical protein
LPAKVGEISARVKNTRFYSFLPAESEHKNQCFVQRPNDTSHRLFRKAHEKRGICLNHKTIFMVYGSGDGEQLREGDDDLI